MNKNDEFESIGENIVNAQVALKGYRNIQVNAGVAGASPHRLIEMLYEGLLERIAQLKGAIEQNNIELKHLKVNQATSIVLGLRDALNADQNNEMVSNLDNLYDYIQRQIFQANLKNSPEILDECTSLITEVSSAWREIASSVQ